MVNLCTAPFFFSAFLTNLAAYPVCTCRQQGGTWWWEDKGPVQTPDWRQGCGKSGGPDTLTELSATVEKKTIGWWGWICERSTIICCVRVLTGLCVYLDSNWRSTFIVLFCSLVWVRRGAQMLVWDPSSVEGWEDRHWCLGGTLNSEGVSFTGVHCVVLQDVEQIDCTG